MLSPVPKSNPELWRCGDSMFEMTSEDCSVSFERTLYVFVCTCVWRVPKRGGEEGGGPPENNQVGDDASRHRPEIKRA